MFVLKPDVGCRVRLGDDRGRNRCVSISNFYAHPGFGRLLAGYPADFFSAQTAHFELVLSPDSHAAGWCVNLGHITRFGKPTEPKTATLTNRETMDAPVGAENLAGLIRKMVDHGITVCLIEHKMDMIMSLADKIMVLDHGEKIAEGTPEQIKNDPVVIEAYLGSDEDVEA